MEGAGEHACRRHGRCSSEDERMTPPRMSHDNGYFITFYPEIGYLLVLECPIEHVVLCQGDNCACCLSYFYERARTIFGTPCKTAWSLQNNPRVWLISRRNVIVEKHSTLLTLSTFKTLLLLSYHTKQKLLSPSTQFRPVLKPSMTRASFQLSESRFST